MPQVTRLIVLQQESNFSLSPESTLFNHCPVESPQEEFILAHEVIYYQTWDDISSYNNTQKGM